MGKLEYKTLRQEVTNTLRMKILSGEIKPGERIVEQDMAENLGVSRGPVREALREIEQEGLVEYARNIGCSVRRFSDKDIYEIYLLRGTLESLAVQLCDGKVSAQTIELMQAILEKMSDTSDERAFDHAIEYDNMFHQAILNQVNLPRITQCWTSLSPCNVIIFYSGSNDKMEAVKRQKKIHKDLLDAFKTNDINIITQAIMHHYMLTTNRRLKEQGNNFEQNMPYYLNLNTCPAFGENN